MQVKDILEYFSVNGSKRGAQARFAKFCNMTPQNASHIVRSGVVPFNIQCELQARTNGVLKVDPELIGKTPNNKMSERG